MAKKIILLSDGTGNSAAKVWRTNVWRVFESIDLSGSDQVAFYDDGVGTSSFKPLAILGGAFGWGLKRNVLHLYKFLCRNYKSSQDEIFAFGFSRGAFTIRVLTGFVVSQGLVDYKTEAELEWKAKAAYRTYRAEKFHTSWPRWCRPERLMRWIRNRFVSATHDKNQKPVDKIKFLGLWDTVAAYGLPVDEMTRGVSRYLWPLELPDHQLHPKVERACHALSLDDERTTFHPVLWDEEEISPLAPDPKTGKRYTIDERLSQVWFAGVHSNVGGGYPDDSLACVSLNWIMMEAAARGLRFKTAPASDPDSLVHGIAAEDKDGRLYDSRSGLGGYYRYGPRKLDDLCHASQAADLRDRVEIPVPRVHESVLERIEQRAHLYAPIVLPERYEVVTRTGEIRAPGQSGYEAPDEARARTATQEAVWNLVWRRRAIYFLTVFTSLYLATYPFYHKTYKTTEFTTPLRHVSDSIRMFESVLPSGAGVWLNSYAHEPGWFVLIAVLVGALIFIGSRLGAAITDRMSGIWQDALNPGSSQRQQPPKPGAVKNILKIIAVTIVIYAIAYPLLPLGYSTNGGSCDSRFRCLLGYYSAFPVNGILAVLLVALLLPERWIYALRTSDWYRRGLLGLKLRYAPAFFALFFLYLGLAFGSHFLFTAEDAFGQVCRESDKHNQDELQYCGAPTIAYCEADMTGVNNKKTPVCANKRVQPQCQIGEPICGTRDSDTVAMCGSTPAVCPKPCIDDVAIVPFDTSKACHATGLVLEQWGTYRITVMPKEDRWYALDGRIETNAGGFRITSLDDPIKKAYMLLLWPLKRSFIRPWFSVIARVGPTGNDEEFLDPDDPDEDETCKPNERGDVCRLDDSSKKPKNAPLEESKFKPRRKGELFLYVNDAVFAGALISNYIPYFDYFYRGNKGTAQVKIERIQN
jgi:uncharacterized protein (DUF2235 family)